MFGSGSLLGAEILSCRFRERDLCTGGRVEGRGSGDAATGYWTCLLSSVRIGRREVSFVEHLFRHNIRQVRRGLPSEPRWAGGNGGRHRANLLSQRFASYAVCWAILLFFGGSCGADLRTNGRGILGRSASGASWFLMSSRRTSKSFFASNVSPRATCHSALASLRITATTAFIFAG